MAKLEKIAEIDHPARIGAFSHKDDIISSIKGRITAYTISSGKLIELDYKQSEKKESVDFIAGPKELYSGISADFREYGKEEDTRFYYGKVIDGAHTKFIETLKLEEGELRFYDNSVSINNNPENLTVLNNNFIATSNKSYLNLYKTGEEIPQNVLTQDFGSSIEGLTPMDQDIFVVMTGSSKAFDCNQYLHFMKLQKNPHRLVSQQVTEFDGEGLGSINGIHYLRQDRFVINSWNKLNFFEVVKGEVEKRISIPLRNDSIAFNKDKNLMAAFRTGWFAPSSPKIEVYNFSLD